jgi:hypothetical protein
LWQRPDKRGEGTDPADYGRNERKFEHAPLGPTRYMFEGDLRRLIWQIAMEQ